MCACVHVCVRAFAVSGGHGGASRDSEPNGSFLCAWRQLLTVAENIGLSEIADVSVCFQHAHTHNCSDAQTKTHTFCLSLCSHMVVGERRLLLCHMAKNIFLHKNHQHHRDTNINMHIHTHTHTHLCQLTMTIVHSIC